MRTYAYVPTLVVLLIAAGAGVAGFLIGTARAAAGTDVSSILSRLVDAQTSSGTVAVGLSAGAAILCAMLVPLATVLALRMGQPEQHMPSRRMIEAYEAETRLREGREGRRLPSGRRPRRLQGRPHDRRRRRRPRRRSGQGNTTRERSTE